MQLLLIQEGWGPGAAGWQQCASVGGGGAAVTGLVCSGVEVVVVVVGSGAGRQGGNGCGVGLAWLRW